MQNFEVPIFNDGVFTPNPGQLWWIFLFEILHFMMIFLKNRALSAKNQTKKPGKACLALE